MDANGAERRAGASIVTVGLFAAAVGAGVFVLPWWIPVRDPSGSASYLVGFHNRAAWAALVGAATLVPLLAWWRRAWFPWIPALAEAAGGAVRLDGTSSRIPVALALALGVAGSAVSFALLEATRYPPLDEANSFLPRIDQMLMGQQPYRDFAFYYGPGMLWGPLLLWRLGAGWLAIDDAYYLFLALSCLAGLALFAVAARRLALPPALAGVAFLVTAPWTTHSQGLNYVALRFAVPIAAPFLVHFAADRRSAWVRAAACCAGALLLSPEMGFATLAVLLVLFACRKDFAGIGACLGGALLVPLVAGAGPITTLFNTGGGGLDFPIVPNRWTVAYVALLAFTLLALSAAFLRAPRAPGAPLFAALVAQQALLAMPALGRCDVGHVAFNGAAAPLLAIAIAHRLKPAAGWVAALLWVIGVTVPMVGGIPATFRHQIAQTATVRAPPVGPVFTLSEETRRSPFFWRHTPPLPVELAQLDRVGPIGAPFGSPLPVDRYLKLKGLYVPERHPGPSYDIITEADVRAKIADLERMSAILLPSQDLALAGTDEADARDIQLSIARRVLESPIPLAPRDVPLFFPRRDAVRAATERFRPVVPMGDFWLAVSPEHSLHEGALPP